MEDQVRYAFLRGELDGRLEVFPARVDAPVRNQPDQVQATAGALDRPPAGTDQGLVVEEGSVGDRVVDPGEVLGNDRSGAEVEVTDLGVAHLSLGQTDIGPPGGQGGVGEGVPQSVEDRRFGEIDRVSGSGLGQPPSVEDDQRKTLDREPGRRFKGEVAQRSRAAVTIAAKSSGSSDAPPTRAPSMSPGASS